jgi:hypothetical protein
METHAPPPPPNSEFSLVVNFQVLCDVTLYGLVNNSGFSNDRLPPTPKNSLWSVGITILRNVGNSNPVTQCNIPEDLNL